MDRLRQWRSNDTARNCGWSPAARLAALLAAAVLASTLPLSCKSSSKSATGRSPVVAVVFAMEGSAQIRARGGDYWFGGSMGTSLYEGDTLQTGESEDLVLVFVDGTRLQLGRDGYYRLRSGSGKAPRVEIDRGALWLEDPSGRSTISLETPAATASATDAQLDLKVDPGGGTTLTVVGGKARFSNDDGSVTVEEDSQSTAVPGSAPTKPVASDVKAATSWVRGYDYFVEMQVDPYFQNEGARDTAEADARAKVRVDPTDKWSHVTLARAVLDVGDLPGARSEFNAAIELDPQFRQALEGLGRVDLLEGRWSEAADLFAKARRLDRQSTEALFGLGQASLGMGDLTEAQKWYRDVLEQDSADAKSWVGLGLVKFLQHDLEGAVDCFKEARSIDPNLARAPLGLGIVYAAERRADLAARYFGKALDLDSQGYLVWNALGIHDMRRGKWDEAMDCFNRLKGSEESWVKALGYQNLGVARETRNQTRTAIEYWLKSIDLLPDRPGVLFDLGLSRLEMGEGEAALETLSRAVQLQPENFYAHETLARAFWTLGMPAPAEEQAGLAVELNPSSFLSHAILGLTLEARGEESEARAEFKEARGLVVEKYLTAEERSFLGRTFAAEKDYRSALSEYEKAAKMAPRVAGYRCDMGDALAAQKKKDEALEEYRRAMEIDPDSHRARAGVASMLRAKGDLEGAIRELEQAVERNPGDVEAMWMLGECRLEDGDIKGALEELAAARDVGGTAPALLAKIMVATGNAYDRLQDFGQAIAAYQEAIHADSTRGDAWFYLAGDLERTGALPDAKNAYRMAFELCRSRDEWKEFYRQSAEKLEQIK